MGNNAWITPTGQVEINPHAWMERNTGPALPDLTAALHQDLSPAPTPTTDPATNTAIRWAWTWVPEMWSPTLASALDRLPGPDREQAARALRWCRSRGWALTEPALIVHVGTRLNGTVWIVRATTAAAAAPAGPAPVPASAGSHGPAGTHGSAGGHGSADSPGPAAVSGQRRFVVVVAGVNGRPVGVYRETTPDIRTWYDSDTVIIRCPNGHAWLWGPERQLTTSAGHRTTMTTVFGPNLDAPFSPCPRCTQHQTAHRGDAFDGQLPSPGDACDCDGTPWIICPLCDQRCDLDLPR